MFLSQGAHPHVLPPAAYSAPEAFAAEQRGVWPRVWNVVCSESQLAKHGDQFATELGGIPIVVRNDRGTVRAFRNVCAHRHSLVARPGFSSCPEALRCQYHGWEYGSDGRLAKLPDGTSFKGWKATEVRLDSVRCEVAWGLVFVNPSPGSATIREDFGWISTDLDRHFGSTKLYWIKRTEHDVNWKVIVENAIEGYHTPMVHQSTFVSYWPEAKVRHVIEPAFTQFHDLTAMVQPRERLLDQVLFVSPRSYGYSHTHVFPNHLITFSSFYREWVVVEPIAPRRSRRIAYGFFPDDLRFPGRLGLPLRLKLEQLARQTRKVADQIFEEDASLWDSIQRGTETSTHAGVLSAREERVAAFQRWVVDRCATS
jgi:phenylpropionate dioxygenase-like ring-hydroxylating dioxygenase large terminal subunit